MSEFTLHSRATAPDAARPFLDSAEKIFGFVPNLQRAFAESPAILEGYMTLWEIFGRSSFTQPDQQVVYLTINCENECHYCMAGHSGLARMIGVPEDMVNSVRAGKTIADPRLEALRRFAARMVASRGWVEPDAVDAFLSAGYSKQAALDVILGIAVKVMSNYANHLAETPVDDVMRTNPWSHPDRRIAAE